MDYQTPHPSDRLRVKVYGFRYACDVVNSFAGSYARATNFVAKKLELDPKTFLRMLTRQFMRHNMMWNMTRDTIKRIEKLDMYDDLAQYSVENFTKYLTNEKQLVIEAWLDSEI